MKRYKLGVKVIMGELKGQGIKVTSKCLWDTAFDNWASYKFSNDKMYCLGIIYGCYYE
jgi:tctex1 domain-containing protein 2